MGYFLAPAGKKLWDEVRTRFPGRDSSSDGWIGDASHQARPSDHNPCYSCTGSSYGIVRAVDLDGDGWPAEQCVQYILARCRAGLEKRVAYIIYKRRIWSVTYGWAQRYYSGINPHYAHFHVSLKRDSSNFQTQSWLPTFPSGAAPPPPPPADPPPPPPPVEEEEDMAKQFNVVADPAGAMYSVTWQTVQHVPDPSWQGLLDRMDLISPVAPQTINMVQLEWLMRSVLTAGGSVGCAKNCGVCLMQVRYKTWADASNDRAAIAKLTSKVDEILA